MEIKFDTVQVTKAINGLTTEVKNLRSSISSMQTLTGTTMHNHWKGSDYDEGFIKKMDPFLDEKLTDYVSSIESYQKYLKNYSDGFKALHAYYEAKKITIVGR